jgi:adenylate kinase family enzyme
MVVTLGAQRVAIIGCSGSGKSTLARRIAERLALPVVYLDVLYWRPGWKDSEYQAFRARVAEALAGDRWITDGNFSGVADIYMPAADLIVLVDQPRWLCLWRAIRRAVVDKGAGRADLPEGCPEKFDVGLWTYIWNWNRVTRRKMEAAIALHAPNAQVVRLSGDAEIKRWLECV